MPWAGVMFTLVGLAVRSSWCKFCDNWNPAEFFSVGVRNMLTEGLHSASEEFSNLIAVHPNCHTIGAYFNCDSADLELNNWLIYQSICNVMLHKYVAPCYIYQ